MVHVAVLVGQALLPVVGHAESAGLPVLPQLLWPSVTRSREYGRVHDSVSAASVASRP